MQGALLAAQVVQRRHMEMPNQRSILNVISAELCSGLIVEDAAIAQATQYREVAGRARALAGAAGAVMATALMGHIQPLAQKGQRFSRNSIYGPSTGMPWIVQPQSWTTRPRSTCSASWTCLPAVDVHLCASSR